MRPLRKWLALTAPAALAALMVGVAPAASAAPAAPAPHVNEVIHIVHRGLVNDQCRYITNYAGNAISGNGVNKQVTLKSTGNCFTQHNMFHIILNGKTYTGWEYQNGDGHCLWENQTSQHLELGVACQAGNLDESFFGISYYQHLGWVVGVASYGLYALIYNMDAPPCHSGSYVDMAPATDTFCPYWNFPPG